MVGRRLRHRKSLTSIKFDVICGICLFPIAKDVLLVVKNWAYRVKIADRKFGQGQFSQRRDRLLSIDKSIAAIAPMH